MSRSVYVSRWLVVMHVGKKQFHREDIADSGGVVDFSSYSFPALRELLFRKAHWSKRGKVQPSDSAGTQSTQSISHLTLANGASCCGLVGRSLSTLVHPPQPRHPRGRPTTPLGRGQD